MNGSDDAREWVEIAEGNLATAHPERAVEGRANVRAVAFHLQQAIEKLMKAVLVSRGIASPRTHDLVYLSRLLQDAGVESCATTEELSVLSAVAVESRYPGEPPSLDDAALLLSITVRAWNRRRPLV